MSEIIVREVTDKKELKTFVKFPFKLYSNNEYWVPPIIQDELDDFNPKKNPSFQYSEIKHWLAYRNGETVGRIAAIKHGPEFEEHGKIRFGWIDFEDDPKISAALVSAVEKWARSLGGKEVHGPLGFNDMGYEGLLVEGFDSLATIATIYNHPYYKDHLEQLGFNKATDWIEIRATFDFEIPQRLERLSDYLCERFKLKPIELKNSKDVAFYAKKLFETLNKSYTSLYGFHELTQQEIDFIIKKYLSFASPKYLSFIEDEHGRVVAFGVTMPSLSRAFQKANGRLFPFGFVHLLKSLKSNKIMDMYLVGVHPDYQNTGVISIVFHELWKRYIAEGVTQLNSNPTLEDNNQLFNIWKSLGGKDRLAESIAKRRRCYSKIIS